MSSAPHPEPRGCAAVPGFVKSNPRNNDHYVEGIAGNPWYPIIKRTHERLTQLDPGYNITQIKEKFGGLRYYFASTLDSDDPLRQEMKMVVSEAESWVEGYETAIRLLQTHKD